MGAAVAIPENAGFLPEGGWSAVFGSVGTAVWFFIGFEFACPMAEENKKPYKNIPYALISGLITIYIVDVIFTYGAVKYTDLSVMGSLRHAPGGCLCGNAGPGGRHDHEHPDHPGLFHHRQRLYGGTAPDAVRHGSGEFGAQVFWKPPSQVSGAHVGTGVHGVFDAADHRLHHDTGRQLRCDHHVHQHGLHYLAGHLLHRDDRCAGAAEKVSRFPAAMEGASRQNRDAPSASLAPVYAISTLAYVLPQACVVMAIVAIYAFVWNKAHKIPVNETVPLETYVNRVRERSEYLPVWDEAVVEWMNQRASAQKSSSHD